jgi:uncharacterized protein (TIGR02466 family)
MAGEFDLGGRKEWATMFFFRRWEGHRAEAPAIVDYLLELRKSATANIASGVAPAAKSMDGLFESDFDLFKRDHPGLKQLFSWIQQTLRQAVSIANEGKARPEQVRVEIPDSWYHVSNDGGFHDAHFHSNCSWCGIFYLQAGDSKPSDKSGAGNGVSRFYSPIGSGALLNDFGNSYLSSNRIDLTPTDGMLVLFPAYLLHAGLPYRGERDRIVIAFNSRSYLVEAATPERQVR